MIDHQLSEKEQGYTAAMGQCPFTQSGIIYDAILRNLELIGEAPAVFPTMFVSYTPIFPGE